LRVSACSVSEHEARHLADVAVHLPVLVVEDAELP
jgi:hypothetical protein